jgi:hypothetical protein
MTAEERFKSELPRVFQGFDVDKDLRIGSAVVWDGAPEERGSAAFTRHTVRSGKQYAEWLADTTDDRAVAARNYFEFTLEAKIAQGVVGPEERDRMFKTGEAWTPVQIADKPAGVVGTSHYVKPAGQPGRLVLSSDVRKVGAGDAFLVWSKADGSIDADLTGRCDCGNPHVTVIRPLQPGENPTPIEYPPKIDDGVLPQDPNDPYGQQPGTKDKHGKGPAEQPADPVSGTIASETTVAPPPTTTVETTPPTTSKRPTATTTPAPTSTAPPAPATSSVPTTAPQTGPLPTQP